MAYDLGFYRLFQTLLEDVESEFIADKLTTIANNESHSDEAKRAAVAVMGRLFERFSEKVRDSDEFSKLASGGEKGLLLVKLFKKYTKDYSQPGTEPDKVVVKDPDIGKLMGLIHKRIKFEQKHSYEKKKGRGESDTEFDPDLSQAPRPEIGLHGDERTAINRIVDEIAASMRDAMKRSAFSRHGITVQTFLKQRFAGADDAEVLRQFGVEKGHEDYGPALSQAGKTWDRFTERARKDPTLLKLFRSVGESFEVFLTNLLYEVMA